MAESLMISIEQLESRTEGLFSTRPDMGPAMAHTKGGHILLVSFSNPMSKTPPLHHACRLMEVHKAD